MAKFAFGKFGNMEEPVLNAHNKEEYPPMHTAEHILNGTMVRLFGCPRSRNAHIERKKSKCDYLLDSAGTWTSRSSICPGNRRRPSWT